MLHLKIHIPLLTVLSVDESGSNRSSHELLKNGIILLSKLNTEIQDQTKSI